MNRITGLCVVLVASLCLAAEPATKPVAPTTGLLMLSGDAAPDAGRLELKLETHAKLIGHIAVVQQTLKANPKLRDLESLKKAAAEGTDPAAFIQRRLSVAVIPHSLLISMDLANNEISPADAAEILQRIGDHYLSTQQRAASNRVIMELEVAKQWRERYTREIEQLKDRSAVLRQAIRELKNKTENDIAALTAEAASTQAEADDYRQLLQKMEERVAILQQELSSLRSELTWGVAPIN